jgi:hypothetical protein
MILAINQMTSEISCSFMRGSASSARDSLRITKQRDLPETSNVHDRTIHDSPQTRFLRTRKETEEEWQREINEIDADAQDKQKGL